MNDSMCSLKMAEEAKIPGWAGYKSLVSLGQSVTQMGVLPLLPEVAHEWPLMLTVMLQAFQLKRIKLPILPHGTNIFQAYSAKS